MESILNEKENFLLFVKDPIEKALELFKKNYKY
jgi:hypothetical protein